MIVVDPDFTDVPLKGTFVWTSGISDVPDPEDGTKKFGVQFIQFDHFIQTIMFSTRNDCGKFTAWFTINHTM